MNSNDKGKRGEREFAKKLCGYGILAARGRQFSGSPDSPDVQVPDDFPFHFEVKYTEKLKLYPALFQAIEDCGKKTPVVAHKANHKPWVVVMTLSHFMKLVSDANF